MPLEFADTSAGFLPENGVDKEGNPLNPVVTKTPENDTAVAEAAAAQVVQTTEAVKPVAGSDEPPVATLKDSYLEWAKGKGLNLKPEDVPEMTTPEELEAKVAEYYVDKSVKDPFMKELIKKGLDVEGYYAEIQPIRDLLKLNDTELYINEKVTEELNELVTKGELKADDDSAIQEKALELAEALREKTKGIDAKLLTDVTKGIRAKYQQMADEVPNKIREQQRLADEDARTKALDSYKNYQKDLVTEVQQRLVKERKIAIPFSGHATADDFVKYFNEQTEYREFQVDVNGVKKNVQDIPFLYRINNDKEYMVSVLRMMYALDKGEFTEVKNAMKRDAFAELSLEPVIRSGSGSGDGGSKFAPTHKGIIKN